MHIPAAKLFKHQHIDRCNRATEIQLLILDVEMDHKEGDMEFILYGW